MISNGHDIQFFIGKGGVGKSTTSALSALNWSKQKRRTLLVSMDPAHNQRDLFELDFSEKEMRVADFLWVKEIDPQWWAKQYLEQTRGQIQRTYSYHSAFNLETHLNIMQFSPGIEEYALLSAFESILRNAEDKDLIVFDMAPSALTLRFFSLPTISLLWLDELLKLRNHICEKKEIISNIKKTGKPAETDKVKRKLIDLSQNYSRLQDCFLSAKSRINLVINNDKLSFAEAIRVRGKLEDIGIKINRIVLNKVKSREDVTAIENVFGDLPIVSFPWSTQRIESLDRLNAYLNKNSSCLAFQ